MYLQNTNPGCTDGRTQKIFDLSSLKYYISFIELRARENTDMNHNHLSINISFNAANQRTCIASRHSSNFLTASGSWSLEFFESSLSRRGYLRILCMGTLRMSRSRKRPSFASFSHSSNLSRIASERFFTTSICSWIMWWKRKATRNERNNRRDEKIEYLMQLNKRMVHTA